MERVQLNKKEIRDLLLDFLPVYFLILLIFGVGAFALQFLNITPLGASNANALGEITSIFANATWANYLEELGFFSVPIIFLLFTSLFSENRRIKILFFVLLSFLMGMAGTLLWVILPHIGYSIGPSGVTYAGIGITFAFAITNSLTPMKRLKTASNKVLAEFTGSLATFIGFVIWILAEPTTFFAIQKGINFELHELAFLLGMTSWLVYYGLNVLKLKYNKRKIEYQINS